MPVIRVPHLNLRNIRGLILFVAVIGLLAVSSQLVNFIADLLWFEEVGYQNVFFITILAKLKAAVFFGTGFFIILYANLFLTVRLSSRIFIIEREDTIRIPSLDISNQSLHLRMYFSSLFMYKQRNRHIPHTLTRNTPIRALVYHSSDTLFALFRHPMHFFNFSICLLL
jgi:hypothetical protein